MAQSREERLAVKKKYREENQDKIKQQGKEYREKNREKVLAAKKEYREKNKDKILGFAKVYRKDYIKTHRGRAQRLLSSCRRRAKLSGSAMTLTLEWALQRLENGACEVTQLPFSYERKDEHTRSAFAPSVDRIDPRNTNYTPENCRVVLWAVNNTFAEYGEEIMLPILEAIVNAKEKSTTPVPTEINKSGKEHSEFRIVSATWSGEDDDYAHHHCGADARKDINRSTETSS